MGHENEPSHITGNGHRTVKRTGRSPDEQLKGGSPFADPCHRSRSYIQNPGRVLDRWSELIGPHPRAIGPIP